MRIGVVAELWMYPVQSMRGQRVDSVALDSEGIRGDRRFAFESSNAPIGKPLLSGRERAAMLLYAPEGIDGEQIVSTPDGMRIPLQSSALLEHLPASGLTEPSRFRLQISPDKPLTDVRAVSLLSTATLNALAEEMGHAVNPQRFRSNIVLKLDDAAPFGEDAWSGRVLRFGDDKPFAGLILRERIPRCRMVSLDPQTAEPESTILRHLARAHDGRLGMYATVKSPGMLRRGQPVFLV